MSASALREGTRVERSDVSGQIKAVGTVTRVSSGAVIVMWDGADAPRGLAMKAALERLDTGEWRILSQPG